MSISGALSNALSGLNASSMSARVVSDNLANALNDGFGRREIQLAARSQGAGGGVEVTSITRLMNQSLLTDRRAAGADLSGAQTRSAFYAQVQDLQGEPGSGVALTDLVAQVEAALVSAAARPDQEARQNQVVDRLSQLVDRVGTVAEGIQTARSDADGKIATAVNQLNSDLAQIAQLNSDIRKAAVRGQSPSALLDTRQNLIDRVSELVPVRELDRGHGMVALMTEGGMLLDGAAPTLSFQRTPVITAHHDYSSGLLSGISVNTQNVDLSRDRHLLSGGKLEALIDVRDRLAPDAQAKLDGFARDLVERFSAPGVDPTVPAGAPHLLTDSGAAFAVGNETGLAARLTLNAAVDPAQGGQVSRLRDGLGSAAPGPVGDAAGLTRLISALSAVVPPGSGALSGAGRSAAGQAADLYSQLGTARGAVDNAQAYARARHDGLAAELMADGVDSDAEMQKLLLIEQAYAANARVVSAAQGMLDVLMEI